MQHKTFTSPIVLQIMNQIVQPEYCNPSNAANKVAYAHNNGTPKIQGWLTLAYQLT